MKVILEEIVTVYRERPYGTFYPLTFSIRPSFLSVYLSIYLYLITKALLELIRNRKTGTSYYLQKLCEIMLETLNEPNTFQTWSLCVPTK